MVRITIYIVKWLILLLVVCGRSYTCAIPEVMCSCKKKLWWFFFKFGFISSWTWEITYVIRSGTCTSSDGCDLLQSFASPLTQLNSRKCSRDWTGQSSTRSALGDLMIHLYLIGQFSHVNAFLNFSCVKGLYAYIRFLQPSWWASPASWAGSV